MKHTPLKHTPLYDEHKKLNALMVDFAGWEMPLHYGSQIEEHHLVRQDAGMFDVSHMGVIDITGDEVPKFLRYLLANNIEKLKNSGSALYTCMLNHAGGVIDDLIVYYISPAHYRLIVNASTLLKVKTWMLKEAKIFSVSITHQETLAILAIQGPNARKKAAQVLSRLYSSDLQSNIETLKPFQFLFDNPLQISRTGYTGEDGVEIVLPSEHVIPLWRALRQAEVAPIGLGARDTLRLEAGFNLYGQDMDETVTPLESNLGWTVAFEPVERDFIGRTALAKQQLEGLKYQLTGICLLEKGVLRHDQTVWVDKQPVGKITSGSFSPTLKRSIALARIHHNLQHGCEIDIRGKYLKAEIVVPPFIHKSRKGDALS